jgi:hypothetical protein
MSSRTLLASVHELKAVLDEFPRDIENLLNLVRHVGYVCNGNWVVKMQQ